MHSQRILLSYSVFLIPWDTPANNPFKAKVFHIIKVESKSISYHAFSFLLLVLIAYLALLSSTHLQHFVLLLRLPHLSGEQIREVKMIPRSMWRQFANSSSARDKEKESKRWALGKIEERIRPKHLYLACLPCRRNMLIHPQLGTRRKKARGGHLERLKKESDQNLCLVPARHAEETSREECRLCNSRSEFQTSSRSKLWKVNKHDQ
ncbi:hypothetical protein C1H46_016614 [Malus baccata]|uniref:Uncharacterized protein n=1 Tax=Malus baccata TaxID=106549 RepID=A0A540MG62_MALBA|nr:hypothetical protein C1H46_016614 [Malus baccata]